MHLEAIVTFFHPGDLSIGDWVRLLGMFVAFIVLPIGIIGFIIFKVVNGHLGEGASESEESITLRLGDSTPK